MDCGICPNTPWCFFKLSIETKLTSSHATDTYHCVKKKETTALWMMHGSILLLYHKSLCWLVFVWECMFTQTCSLVCWCLHSHPTSYVEVHLYNSVSYLEGVVQFQRSNMQITAVSFERQVLLYYIYNKIHILIELSRAFSENVPVWQPDVALQIISSLILFVLSELDFP